MEPATELKAIGSDGIIKNFKEFILRKANNPEDENKKKGELANEINKLKSLSLSGDQKIDLVCDLTKVLICHKLGHDDRDGNSMLFMRFLGYLARDKDLGLNDGKGDMIAEIEAMIREVEKNKKDTDKVGLLNTCKGAVEGFAEDAFKEKEGFSTLTYALSFFTIVGPLVLKAIDLYKMHKIGVRALSKGISSKFYSELNKSNDSNFGNEPKEKGQYI